MEQDSGPEAGNAFLVYGISNMVHSTWYVVYGIQYIYTLLILTSGQSCGAARWGEAPKISKHSGTTLGFTKAEKAHDPSIEVVLLNWRLQQSVQQPLQQSAYRCGSGHVGRHCLSRLRWSLSWLGGAGQGLSVQRRIF